MKEHDIQNRGPIIIDSIEGPDVALPIDDAQLRADTERVTAITRERLIARLADIRTARASGTDV